MDVAIASKELHVCTSGPEGTHRRMCPIHTACPTGQQPQAMREGAKSIRLSQVAGGLMTLMESLLILTLCALSCMWHWHTTPRHP